MNKVTKKKSGRAGRPPEADKARDNILCVRVTIEEREAIKRYFGTSSELRKMILEVISQGKVSNNGITTH